MLPLFLLHVALLSLLCLAAQTDLYKILSLDRSCSTSDLKRAYRHLSKKYHPDKSTGNESKFLEVTEAYETLSNPETRQIYDQYGFDGLENHKRTGGQPAHNNPFDLFSQFFGGGGGGRRQGGGQRRGPDMEVQLRIPLRDFYNGKEVSFSLEKQAICEHCSGSGSEDGVVETCNRCGGRGIIVQKHQLAPGMFQQVQSHCDQCGGQGKQIKRRCKVCGGNKVVNAIAEFVADIEPGMSEGHTIVFEGEGAEHPDHVPGDLRVRVLEQEARIEDGKSDSGVPFRVDGAFFRRKGRDLYYKEVLGLREAWMGDWTRNVTHLDGRTVKLGRKRGEVVQPGQVDTVVGEGMPIWKEGEVNLERKRDDSTYGRLFVEYVVVLPDQMKGGMEKEFWGVWEKWRKKKGVDLHKDSGRPVIDVKSEL